MGSLGRSYGHLLLALNVGALVGCDHVTKVAAKAELGGGVVRSVVSNLFELRYAENRDIAFNLLDQVPEAGAIVVVSFPKPKGGSGFPARVFAILP